MNGIMLRPRLEYPRLGLLRITFLLMWIAVAGQAWALKAQSSVLRVQNAVIAPGQSGTVTIQLDARGIENSVGFSILFDTAFLTYQSAVLGSGATGSSFIKNESQQLSGKVGFLVGLSSGSVFPAGTLNLVVVTFSVPSGATGSSPTISITDSPVVFEISDVNGLPVSSSSTNGTVCLSPSISAHPASTTICAGSTASLSVTATGSTTFHYAWYQGNSGNTSIPAPGAGDSPNYTTPALSATTRYWVRVTNSCGQANSNSAIVTVNPATAITAHPASTLICSNSVATLTVTATGSGTLSYQWYQGSSGDTSTPVGTNSTSFTTPPLTTTTSYWVRVTGSCGSANSNTATLTVGASLSIVTHPASTSMCPNQKVTLTVTATGGGTISYQWYQGSSGDTSAPVGTNSASYTTPSLTTTASYWVRVASSGCGSVDSNTATITVWEATQITSQPHSTAICPNKSTTLLVSTTGHGTFSYSWYQGITGDTSTPASGGKNSASYTTPALTASTNYWVRVTDNCGSADSNTAVVMVYQPPSIDTPPQSLFIQNGHSANLAVMARGTAPLHYAWYQGTSGVTGIPAPNAIDSPSYTTPNLTENTSYWVRVSNVCQEVDSQTAYIRVIAFPLDLNGDGVIDVLDIHLEAELLASNIIQLPCGSNCADVNNDNQINILDLYEIMRILVPNKQ